MLQNNGGGARYTYNEIGPELVIVEVGDGHTGGGGSGRLEIFQNKKVKSTLIEI